MLNKRQKEIYRDVLSLPTTPFHEEAVIAYIRNFCRRLKLPVQSDSFGNLKVQYKRGEGSPFVFVAHMDHPGFETVSVGSVGATVRLLGDVDPKQFLKAKIIFFSKGKKVKGKVTKKIGSYYRVTTKEEVDKKSFGSFDLPGCRFRKGKIYTRSADNLMEVSTLLNVLELLVTKRKKGNITCLFTRAEEHGFLGAIGASQNGFLPKSLPLIVLETSSSRLGWAKMGEGPVLRVGDKRASFSADVDFWFQEVAERLARTNRSFQYQRKLLPGGSCESTVFVFRGRKTGCLSIPLGNYHNIGPKSYALEYVSQKDVRGMILLLAALAAEGFSKRGVKALNSRLQKQFLKYSSYLKRTSHV